MNTSVSELIDAFKFANAEEIILLPNETNMIKACEQAAELFKEAQVHVIPTKTLQEGYFVLLNKAGADEDESLYENLLECRHNVSSLIVFKSAKEAKIGNEVAPKGSYVASIRHDLKTYADTLIDATDKLLDTIEDIDDHEVMFIIYGQMVKDAEMEEIIAKINEKHPGIEIGAISGKQDVYDLLIGLI